MRRLVIVGLLLAVPYLASARTWYITHDGTGDAPMIKAGLDSASFGDTVLVAPGTYNSTDDPESWVNAGPGVCLRSAGGPEVTVIEVCNSSIGILCMDCEGACVSGFTVRFGSGPDCHYPPCPTRGICCDDCTNLTVENCIIEDFNYGIYLDGSSSEWFWPVFRDNVIRSCSFGVYCVDVLEPGRPFFEDNIITECNYGADILDSSPMFYGNEITSCRYCGLRYGGWCGGDCHRNIIAHNESVGVDIYADPPLAAPDFNGGKALEEANDFFDNGSCHICYRHSAGPGFVVAQYNYWGGDCPDSSEIFKGEVVYSPWVDASHSKGMTIDDCQGATEPSTWGSIKALYR
jgi:parallel beta-helix repeat protein